MARTSPQENLIAPLSHTILVLLVISALTLFGFYSQRHSLTAAMPTASGSKTLLYLSIIALQYGLLRLVLVGIRRRGRALVDLIGKNDVRLPPLLADAVIAFLFWAVCVAIGKFIKSWLGGVDNHTAGFLPVGVAESLSWIALSIAAGFVEEICYRGYLQKQLMALAGSATLAVLGQSLLFAVSHSYQGFKAVVVIFAFGILFGLLAYWRQSLRPGIMAHALMDIVGGLIK